MEDALQRMFELSVPWWEIVLRACVVYAVVLVLVRMSGKRTVGQFTSFDLLVVVLVGTGVANSLVGDDNSLLGGLISAVTLLLLNWGVGAIAARNRRFERMIEGAPVILARRGELFPEVLRRSEMSERDFAIARRSAGYSSLAQIELAVLETSGEITFIPRKAEPGKGRSRRRIGRSAGSR